MAGWPLFVYPNSNPRNADRRLHPFQTTAGILKLIDNDANLDDLIAFFQERMLPLGDIEAHSLAQEVLRNPPRLGYLTISNALQWRLQYRRIISKAGEVAGIEALLPQRGP